MIETLLPLSARCVESLSDRPVFLYPAEREKILCAVQSRQAEYATVRGCAREAMGQLGIPATALVPGEAGAPVWPTGVVGSMTHCEGFRAAAVALDRDLVTLGIDAEPEGELPAGVLSNIASDSERNRLRRLAGVTGSADRILFSAKESIYKAWYPLTHRFLNFHEADVTIHPGGTFEVKIMLDKPADSAHWPTRFTGRWLVAGGLILTAVYVPASVRH